MPQESNAYDISKIQMESCYRGGGSFSKDKLLHIKTIPETIVAECIHGRYEVQCDTQHALIKPGEMFCVPSMQTVRIVHHQDGHGRMSARWLHLKVRLHRHIDLFAQCTLPLRLTAPKHKQIFSYFNKIHDAPEPINDLAQTLVYHQHCSALSAALYTHALSYNKQDHSALSALYEYVEAHLDQRIHVADLAACMHLSEARFYVVFKSITQQTPKLWLQHMRLERAASLLLDSNDGLESIATQCGLANAFHLSRLFKQWTGKAPSLWRREHKDRQV